MRVVSARSRLSSGVASARTSGRFSTAALSSSSEKSTGRALRRWFLDLCTAVLMSQGWKRAGSSRRLSPEKAAI